MPSLSARSSRSRFARRRPRAAAILAGAALAAMLLGCSEETVTSSLYVVPASLDELSGDHFFDHPWPSDLRLQGGSPRIAGFPNPRQLPILDEYINSTAGVLDGFSPVAAGFLRFDGPIDPTTLPADPLAATDPAASVQLLDIDPVSPEHGTRRLVSLKWRADAGVYYQGNTLAFMPTLGFPLRAHTRYALVVTQRLRGADHSAIGASGDLRVALGLDPADGRLVAAQRALQPAVAELEHAGIHAGAIAHLAVFTTADPTAELFAVADDVHQHVAAPTVDPASWELAQSTPAFDEYLGLFGPSPNYQAGKLPFANSGDGGQFQIKDGHPAVVDYYHSRFSLMVPRAPQCPMPAGGYPIALYAHGTGGDYRSYVDDGTGAAAADRCVAMMGVDQIFHGTRPGAPANGSEATIEILFYNFQNPAAARTNARQSAIDEVQRARLFTETGASVPASISTTRAPIRFDGTRLTFFGHSQGGLNGPLFLAADGAARGGVLSGSSAVLSITLLEKTQPMPSVAGLVESIFLGLLPEEAGEVSIFHPAISLAQTIVDVVDPIHYARHLILEPRPGLAPKSIYMTEGINPDGKGDSYAPPHGIEAHAIAAGLPAQRPEQRPLAESRWGGPQPLTVPPAGLSGNLANGNASGVLAQWAVPLGHDGHFVVFDVPAARAQAAQFLRNLADDPRGRVPRP